MWSANVKVHPWIGTKYRNPCHFKHRTLILGESSYTSEDNYDSSLLIRCIEDDLAVGHPDRDTRGFCRFSTKLRRVIFGVDESLGPTKFWPDVAFYNFVQERVGDTARIRPTAQMWKNSTPCFHEVVNKLLPEKVLVLGKANWNNFRNNFLERLQPQQVGPRIFTLKLDDHALEVGFIQHPSSSMKYDEWRPTAQQLLLT